MAVSAKVWDGDPWLLGTPDGVVDLCTGHVRPNMPHLYVSRQWRFYPDAASALEKWGRRSGIAVYMVETAKLSSAVLCGRSAEACSHRH